MDESSGVLMLASLVKGLVCLPVHLVVLLARAENLLRSIRASLSLSPYYDS